MSRLNGESTKTVGSSSSPSYSLLLVSSIVLSTSHEKMFVCFFFFFFCLAFYLKCIYFVPFDHILSEIICPFCFCVLISNIYLRIKFTAKNWSDLCNVGSIHVGCRSGPYTTNVYSKAILGNFYFKKIVLLFFFFFFFLLGFE